MKWDVEDTYSPFYKSIYKRCDCKPTCKQEYGDVSTERLKLKCLIRGKGKKRTVGYGEGPY